MYVFLNEFDIKHPIAYRTIRIKLIFTYQQDTRAFVTSPKCCKVFEIMNFFMIVWHAIQRSNFLFWHTQDNQTKVIVQFASLTVEREWTKEFLFDSKLISLITLSTRGCDR